MENEDDSVKKKRIGGSKGRTRVEGRRAESRKGRKGESVEEEAKKRKG